MLVDGQKPEPKDDLPEDLPDDLPVNDPKDLQDLLDGKNDVLQTTQSSNR